MVESILNFSLQRIIDLRGGHNVICYDVDEIEILLIKIMVLIFHNTKGYK